MKSLPYFVNLVPEKKSDYFFGLRVMIFIISKRIQILVWNCFMQVWVLAINILQL